MANKEFEDDDPFELTAVAIPTMKKKYVEAMAETFIEEYLRMGWPEVMVLGLFKTPVYQGPHHAYMVFGEDRVKKMIRLVKARMERGRA